MEAASVVLSRRTGEGATAREILEILRAAPLRRPDIVLSLRKFWKDLRSSRTKQFWDTIEQVALAAADMADLDTLDWATRKLFSAFGATWRVNRLFGIKKEAQGEFDQARIVYENILETDPNNKAALKRQVAWFKSNNMYAEAIGHLCWYLKLYTSDSEAWSELGDLYISAGNYQRAIFCYNELVMHDKRNWAAMLTLGDLHYTLGDEENMLTARKYYAQSLNLNPKCNVRALYGLMMSVQALESSSRSRETKNGQLKSWVQKALKSVYQDANPEVLRLLAID